MKINLLTMMISVAFINVIWAGDVSGTITFEGSAPKMKPLRMDADPVCVANNEVKPRKEWLILGKDNGVKNMLVYVKESKSGSLSKNYDAPKDAAVIDQKGCVYVPHVLGIMTGQQLDILNSDGTLHNIHALQTVNKEFNKAIKTLEKERKTKLKNKKNETEIETGQSLKTVHFRQNNVRRSI